MRKLYGDTRYGQVHARAEAARCPADLPPLVCLHPAPSSGLYFATALPMLSRERDVIAPDYPGYGGSDALPEPVTIADYAAAILEFLDAADVAGPVDLLGFHTGCLVAAEMAYAAPQQIRRVVLCDVPCFTAAQQESLREEMTRPLPISAELESLAGPWAFNVGSRLDAVPLLRAFDLFAEHLRAGPRDFFGFAAAFSYDCEGRLAGLRADVTCLATQSGLHAPTEVAARIIPNARFVDVPEVTTAVFEAGAAAISRRISEAL